MNTFLPYPSFEQSAACLDDKRLGKQRVEALQLLRALLHGGSWAKHPAAKMWMGYEGALAVYGVAVCREWMRRGHRDTCCDKICRELMPQGAVMPPWLGDNAFHASHRSNLLRKDQKHYSQFGWEEPPCLPYVWPGTPPRRSA